MYDKFSFLKNINIYTIIYICYANLLFQYFIVLYDAFSVVVTIVEIFILGITIIRSDL